MGSGKSCAAIRYMNENDGNFIYLTPYLDEVERIKECCSEKKFISPENQGDGKLGDLHNLLGRETNISSTHALFSHYNSDTATLISSGDYTLTDINFATIDKNLFINILWINFKYLIPSL